MTDLKQLEPKHNKSLDGAITEEEALAQWELFVDEYTLPKLAKTQRDAESISEGILIDIRDAMIRFILAGWAEIKEDPNDGVVIIQHLRLELQGHKARSLTYKAPTPGQMAVAGSGRTEEMANPIRYMKLASAVSGVNEPTMGKIKGGDRSRMEVIGSLFLRS